MQQNSISNIKYGKKNQNFFRGMSVFVVFGCICSFFEVDLRASEPNWNIETDSRSSVNHLQKISQQETSQQETSQQETSQQDIINLVDVMIFPSAMQREITISGRIALQDWIQNTLTDQLTEEALAYLKEDVLLYGDFLFLDDAYVIHLEEVQNSSSDSADIIAVSIAKSKYDRLRIEMSIHDRASDGRFRNVSVMKDCFPLDKELAHIEFHFVDFLEGSPLVEKILEKEPQLLAYIDSKVNVVRKLQPTDTIQILLQGRFRDGQLRKLDDVLAVKVTHVENKLEQETNKLEQDTNKLEQETSDITKSGTKSKKEKKHTQKSISELSLLEESLLEEQEEIIKTYVFHKVKLSAIYDNQQGHITDETRTEQQYISLWFDDNHRVVSYPFLKTPTDYIIVSSGYGELRSYEVHQAIDFAAPTGTPIYAAAAGIVRKSGVGTGYGYMVHIDHKQLGAYSSLYAHMSKRAVRTGEYVQQGQLIGYVGDTGRSTGPHLHIQLHWYDMKLDPASVLNLN